MSTYVNSGNLFDENNLSQISTFPEWNDPDISEQRQILNELWEKRSGAVEEGLTRKKTGYHWTSYVLRRLGYCFSVAERSPSEVEDIRPDFTLFTDSADFRTARSYRGTRDFFTNAVGVAHSLGWSESLDELAEVPEGESAHPAVELDRYMRLTNMNWGILTNGHTWRLYHRDSSGLLNTFFEIDLMKALKSDNEDEFKYFWLLFSTIGLGGVPRGNAVADRLYD